MHTLHEYVANQLADKIKSRRVVVWYDERGEFQPFVDEVRGGPQAGSEPVLATIAGVQATLAEYAGSILELRVTSESHVSGDTPNLLVVYVPGVQRDRSASVLMELEKAGTTWEPELKQFAKHVLLQKYTLGVVDEMLPFDRKVSYEDLARAAAGNSDAEPPSILKSIFHDTNGNDGLLTAWLVSDARDAEIESKDATRELIKLVKARLGLDVVADSPLSKLRAITLRYVLAGEFRLDLSCDAPPSLDSVAKPPRGHCESAVREIAKRLRTNYADAYAALADRVEDELTLSSAKLSPTALGSIDTFRFEERALLRHAGDLISNCKFVDALTLVANRDQSFWIDRDLNRKSHWEAARLLATLGKIATEAKSAAAKASGEVSAWFDAYTTQGSGWYRLDQAQRRAETWLAHLDEDPDERALAAVRRLYEEAVSVMGDGFTRALVKARWAVPETLHQTRVWSDLIANRPKPVAYFLIDALRYEMGVELSERLPKSSEVSIRALLGVLPSITPIGMAALMPGAAASFTIVEEKGKLGARIEGSFLADLPARKRHAAARVPKLVDLTLDELLSITPSKLGKKLEGAQVVFVRSQEVDHAGEAGFTFQARQIMDSVIDNVARAIRKLATNGVEHAVITADHGHLFFPTDRDESMRIDAPGGNTVELHRRCWIGRGGATPAGCVRVAASALGYASDLDFVFPISMGVFKAGGDLAYHHGGASLQETVIPVLTVRTTTPEVPRKRGSAIEVTGLPDAVTNRIFSASFAYAGDQLTFGATAVTVRPLLIADGKQVGTVGMAVDARFDRSAGTVQMEPGKSVTIAFLLTDENVNAIRVVVQDPSTDAELFRSKNDIPVRLGV